MAQAHKGTADKRHSPAWYLKQAKTARAAAAGKRGRMKSTLLAAAEQLERLAAMAKEVGRLAKHKNAPEKVKSRKRSTAPRSKPKLTSRPLRAAIA